MRIMLQQTDKGILINIKVIPNASRSEIVGVENEELKVRLAAVPDKGEANDELIRFMAKFLSVGKTNVKIVKGQKSRHKQVGVAGVSLEALKEVFQNVQKQNS
jgi:uncharacterized protein